MNATTYEIKVTEHEVIQAMYRFGGGFAQAIARAFEHADAPNFERLRSAFPELWMKYREIAQRARGKQ